MVVKIASLRDLWIAIIICLLLVFIFAFVLYVWYVLRMRRQRKACTNALVVTGDKPVSRVQVIDHQPEVIPYVHVQRPQRAVKVPEA